MFEALFQKVPEYINKKNNIITMILFTSLFALVFINFYEPFNSRSWKPGISDMGYLLYSSLIILTGILVVVLSRIIMYYSTKKGRELFLWQYLLWVLMEITIMASFYTLFEQIALKDSRDVLTLLKGSIRNTSLVLLLPYSISWLYFSWVDKKEKLEKLASDEIEVDSTKKEMIVFNDEKGDFKLSVQSDQLLYLESADNYVKVHYFNKGKIVHFMLRNTLKNLEDRFANTSLIRCHRSYVVNFDKVKVLRKEKDGIYLALDEERVPDIPVSKTYSEKVMARFTIHFS
jgi:DNA-binding LytR/AlgR family response regulator